MSNSYVKNFFGNIPIYWINLKDSEERYNNCVIQLKDYENHLRIEAIDGRDENLFLANYNVIYKYNTLLTPELIAVICSHGKAIKYAYDNCLETVCILEDDFNFKLLQHYPHTLDEIIKKAPDDWEIIQLYYFEIFNQNGQNINTEKYLNEYLEIDLSFNVVNPPLSGTCYIINKIGMTKILSKIIKTDGEKYFKISRTTTPEKLLYCNLKHYMINLPPILYVQQKTTISKYLKNKPKNNYLDEQCLNGERILQFLLNLKNNEESNLLNSEESNMNLNIKDSD